MVTTRESKGAVLAIKLGCSPIISSPLGSLVKLPCITRISSTVSKCLLSEYILDIRPFPYAATCKPVHIAAVFHYRTEDGNFHPIEIDVSDTGTIWRRERVSIESSSAWRLVLEAFVNDGGDSITIGTVNIDDVAFHSSCPA